MGVLLYELNIGLSMSEYQFESIEECKNEEETHEYYKERGWNIIRPKLVKDGKCEHVWEKQSENDYQCSKCLQGFIGVPDGI